MKISARNQLAGKVVEIREGTVNAIVSLEIGSSKKISSTISLEAIKELGLSVGSGAIAVIKSTSVMLGSGNLKISARNQLTGKVVEIRAGAVNAIVVIDTGNNRISSTISLDAVKELGLTVGSEATAIIKATSVMLAAE